jgi:hypothetical protein
MSEIPNVFGSEMETSSRSQLFPKSFYGEAVSEEGSSF